MRTNEPAHSPSASPQVSPNKKSGSPAKAKFAQIAGKAGIKVRSDRPPTRDTNEPDTDPLTLQDRRRWRGVWKKKQQE